MSKKTIIILAVILISGCSLKTPKNNEPTNNEDFLEKICEIGREYEHNAVNKISCQCPENYEFEIVSKGWGPCPREGMNDCPASVLKCVNIDF